jgi:hypothetical protein
VKTTRDLAAACHAQAGGCFTEPGIVEMLTRFLVPNRYTLDALSARLNASRISFECCSNPLGVMA